MVVAEQMAAAASRSGCQVHELTGVAGHNWQFAAATFAVILPALATDMGLS
jgi:hypothetical protein